MYQFPGISSVCPVPCSLLLINSSAIGLGAVLCKARIVTDKMIDAAAHALAGSLDEHEKNQELVYPRLTRIREISAQIALAVMRAAQKDVSGSVHHTAGVVVAVVEVFPYRASTKQACFAKFPILNY
jgi:malic enzyme